MKPANTTISEGEQVADFSNGLRIKFNKPASQAYAISIKPISDELSELERRVIWMWCGEWAKQSTEWATKEDCYLAFKYFFLWPAIADDHADIAELFNRVRQNIPDSQDRALILGEKISRTDASHDQFHAALQAMHHRLTNQPFNIRLTKPDKYKKAREKAVLTGKTQKV